MATTGSEPLDAVLFDMGGVLVELGPLDELLGASMSGDEFWPRWLASPSVRAFESGRCTVDDFAAGLVEELKLDLEPAEVVERFGRFPRGLFPGAAALAAEVGQQVVTGILSNTNALHWETQPMAEAVQNLCHHAFLSFRIGLLKPDQAVFHHVVAELGVAPAQVLFLDDNALNVEAARTAGLQAEVAKGPESARRLLAARGLAGAPA